MHPDWILLEKMFEKHRQEAFVSCDEKCFCWDVEKLLLGVEEIRPTKRGTQFAALAANCAYDDLCVQCIHPSCANYGRQN